MYGQQHEFQGPQHLMYGQQHVMHGQYPVPSTPGPLQPLTWALSNQLDTMMMQEKVQQEYRQKVQETHKECKATVEAEREHAARMASLRDLKLMASPPGTYPGTPGSGGHRQP